jgi:NhaP-type Na+/H+ or K+/H+ antiporter
MIEFDSYGFIIGASLVIVLSYFFNIIAKRTNIPSVLMLLLLGILLSAGLSLLGYQRINLQPALEVLGIAGLILIVLEAALDLELRRDKWPIIWKAFTLAILSLSISAVSIAAIMSLYLDFSLHRSLLYAIPLSIMSSAIIIPSVVNLQPDKREFMIYESTFSDILGIMAFYFTLESFQHDESTSLTLSILSNVLITIVTSVAISIVLILIFQKIRTQVKLFLFLSVLFVLYSVGKLLHLSSLLIILIFGLMLENRERIFRKFLKRYIDETVLGQIIANFKLITLESSFIIRTFFFVIFGMSLTLASLLKWKVLVISIATVILLYGIRYLFLWLIIRRDFLGLLFLIPRGLITILLFYAIPPAYKSPVFDPGILLFTILFTSIAMSVSLIRQSHELRPKIKDDIRVVDVHGRLIAEELISPQETEADQEDKTQGENTDPITTET